MNCAGPEGPANTYGRLVISNEAASAPGVSLSRSANTTVDPATGIVVVETAEKTEDPETGAITELRERSVSDPATGRVEVQRVKVTTHADGSKTYEASSGAFDPASKQYEWKTSTGSLPEGEIDRFGVALSIGYPLAGEEKTILARFQTDQPLTRIRPIMTPQEVTQAREGERLPRRPEG